MEDIHYTEPKFGLQASWHDHEGETRAVDTGRLIGVPFPSTSHTNSEGSMMKTSALLGLLVCVCLQSRTGFAVPITINSVNELQGISSNLAGDYILGGNIDASGFSFAPIGSVISPFTGSFDGNGYTIKNLNITSSQEDVGLFGTTRGTISNVGLLDATILSTSTDFMHSVGGIAARNISQPGRILNSFVTGSVISTTAQSRIGGLVGYNAGEIIGSFSSADVSAGSLISIPGGDAGVVGGLVGHSNARIVSSYATGSVSGTASGGAYGGLAGSMNTGNVISSFSTAAVTATGNGARVGGLIGRIHFGNIDQTYAAGTLGNSGNSTTTGGLIGLDDAPMPATVTSSYFDTQASGYSISDGGLGVTTSYLTSGGLPSGFDPTTWTVAPGQYPYLTALGSPVQPNAPGSPVQLFKQFSQPWGSNLTLNSTTETLAQTGCFITSTAMVLNSFGHDTDPGLLNSFLKPYMPTGPNAGLIVFTQIPQSPTYGQTDGSIGPPVRFLAQTLKATPSPGPLPPGTGDLAVRTQIVTQLQNIISQEGPVILKVPSRNDGLNGYGTSNTHAIVAYQVVGNQIMIRDPGWANSPGTLDDYIDFVNAYVNSHGKSQYQLKNMDGTGTGHDLSWLLTTHSSATLTYVEAVSPFSKTIVQGAAHSPIEVVITDPLGRRLGFDPVRGIYYEEIPNSSYFRDLLPADAVDALLQQLLDQPLEFTIGDYVPGQYRFEVFGIGDGPWLVNFGVNDPVFGFDPFQFEWSGTATNGSYQEFSASILGPTLAPEPSIVMLFSSGLVLLTLFNIPRARGFQNRSYF